MAAFVTFQLFFKILVIMSAIVVFEPLSLLSVRCFVSHYASVEPFDVYLLIFVLALFKISIPQPILSAASFIGAGNGFLAMFMIGLLLEVKINPSEMKIVLKTLLIRVLFGAILMSIVYFIVPIPMLAKKIVVLAMAAPITTVSAVFSKNIGYHRDAPAISSSLSIIISIAVLVVLIIMFA